MRKTPGGNHCERSSIISMLPFQLYGGNACVIFEVKFDIIAAKVVNTHVHTPTEITIRGLLQRVRYGKHHCIGEHV